MGTAVAQRVSQRFSANLQSPEAAGIKRIALVVAQHGLVKIATDEVRSQTAKSVIVTRIFGTVSEAIEWVTA